MTTPDLSGTLAPNANAELQAKAATATEGKKATFSDFLMSPDPNPVSRESHPLFYDSSKNGSKYQRDFNQIYNNEFDTAFQTHSYGVFTFAFLFVTFITAEKYTYLTKEGFGLHKDGTKLHGFTYECLSNSRSKDLFGDNINAAMGVTVNEDGTESVPDDASQVNIEALATALVAAYTDLIINGNDDMTSYLYLTEKAVYALSQTVKDKIGEKLAANGGVALALVTELVATTDDAEVLFKIAVDDRDEDLDLSGIEALNEEHVEKVYAAITPVAQTQGILLNNGVDVNQEWAQNLIGQASNLDKLVGMDFQAFQGLFTASPDAKKAENWEEVLEESINPPAGDELIAHKMYAGLLGTPATAEVPAMRGHLLESGVGLQVAMNLELVSMITVARYPRLRF